MMETTTSDTIIRYFRHLYNKTDMQMASLNPVCKRGCPWCCFQSVEILNWEEPLICKFFREDIKGSEKEKIKRNLEYWFDFFDRATLGKNKLTMHDAFSLLNRLHASEKIPCPFLDDSECKIYKVRPLSCRCHIAINSSNNCKRNPLFDSTPESELYRKIVISDIVNNLPTTLKLLAYVAAPFFELEQRIKPIYHTILETV
jgi:Fe-S-cluster containining protein